MPGWDRDDWITELRRKATACEAMRPDLARDYRGWADDLEAESKSKPVRQTFLPPNL